jgi:hypothetical protein
MKLPENFEWVDNISKIKDPDVALLLTWSWMRDYPSIKS